jgi:hypothetical protein
VLGNSKAFKRIRILMAMPIAIHRNRRKGRLVCMATNAHILGVAAILIAPPTVAAILQPALASIAAHVVHPDAPTALTKYIHANFFTPCVAQLSANNPRIHIGKAVVADSAPLSVVVDFQPALQGGRTVAPQSKTGGGSHLLALAFFRLTWKRICRVTSELFSLALNIACDRYPI